jgi:hypothetical protein
MLPHSSLRKTWFVALLTVPWAALGFSGCSSDSSDGHPTETGGFGGDDAASSSGSKTSSGDDLSGEAGGPGSGGGVQGACHATGDECEFGAECCSGQCDVGRGICAQDVSSCAPAGSSCNGGTECCSLRCSGDVCAAEQCVGDGQDCSGDEQCCSGSCTGGRCDDINGSSASCRSAGNACDGDGDCCSKFCKDGNCALGASFCVQTYDICTNNDQCCHGTCVMQAGANAGYCGLQVSSGSACDNKLVTGEVCEGDCSSCCSRSCAAHPTSGRSICQPPSGCRPAGELCRTDLDCCGGDPEADLPGAGNAHCEDINSEGVGRCKSISCTPQGGICKYDESDYVEFCGGNSTSPNNCCNFLGNKSNCALDRLNIPRCDALSECRDEGEACANSDDCCGGAPCVQNETGKFVCYLPPEGDCVAATGPCTIDGDCCRGSLCIRRPGEASGTCGDTGIDPNPPSGVGGGAGAGNGSGGSNPGSGGGLACAAFGQACEDASDCCGDVPCDGAFCNYIFK